MNKYIVLQCVQTVGIFGDYEPTLKRTIEFRFCIVGAQSGEQAIRWLDMNHSWSPPITLKNNGFHPFTYEGAQSVVSHACDMQQNVRIRGERLDVKNTDPFSEVIKQIPMCVFEGVAGRQERRKLERVEELAETG